jgi:hypothetical protein
MSDDGVEQAAKLANELMNDWTPDPLEDTYEWLPEPIIVPRPVPLDNWTPEPRPIPRELEHPHDHAYFTPVVEWPTLDEKLANPTMLLRLAKHVC